jgi:zinc transporter 1/2/3
MRRAPAVAGSLYNEFPIAGVFVVAGVYVMFLTERVSLDAMAAAEEANCEREASVPVGDLEAGGGSGRFADGENGGETGTADPRSHEHLSALSAARSIVSQHAGHSHAHGSAADGEAAHGHSHAATSPAAPAEGGHAHAHGHVHAHGALVLAMDAAAAKTRAGAATSSSVEEAEEARAAAAAARRRVMTARLLEFSIVVHSFIIGLDLGTTVSEEDEGLRPLVALIIVLFVHQFSEGITLGGYIAELRDAARAFTKLAMAALFAFTVPAGTWIGIGVASSYNPGSQTAIWVTGALNGVTGGMLLYSALITFMAEEFSRDDLGGARGRAVKRGMYASMLLGAACMACWASGHEDT